MLNRNKGVDLCLAISVKQQVGSYSSFRDSRTPFLSVIGIRPKINEFG